MLRNNLVRELKIPKPSEMCPSGYHVVHGHERVCHSKPVTWVDALVRKNRGKIKPGLLVVNIHDLFWNSKKKYSSHKQREAIVKQMEGCRAALKRPEAEENLSYEDLRKGILNEDQYQRQTQQVRDHRDDYNRQIQNLNLAITEAGIVSVKKVFELAINAKELYKSMSREDRLEYLKEVCSNPTLDGLTLQYQYLAPSLIFLK
ncbi:MAG: hypothetical protein K1X29_06595 [Bdellovibrionales bacterium]|nr:hypothetical protein [Bdellovibrionales bacterium]